MLKTDSKKLKTRDFISVGIFSLIYAVVAFVIGGVAQMTPVTFPFMPMIVALFKEVLHQISLSVPQGSSCAIVGPSGAGKTTLVGLIARFWDVKEGQITLGGRDVREYTSGSLLKNFAIVFQNVYLFEDTVENNIRFGRPDASEDEIIAVAKKACCHDFMTRLVLAVNCRSRYVAFYQHISEKFAVGFVVAVVYFRL